VDKHHRAILRICVTVKHILEEKLDERIPNKQIEFRTWKHSITIRDPDLYHRLVQAYGGEIDVGPVSIFFAFHDGKNPWTVVTSDQTGFIRKYGSEYEF